MGRCVELLLREYGRGTSGEVTKRFMKRWLLLCLAFVPLAARAQGAWPRNAKNEIEFVGTLSWPENAQTEAERRALVRCWYKEKLTDMKVSDGYGQSMKRKYQTCCGLPNRAYFPDKRPDELYRISCILNLTPTKKGLNYTLSRFIWAYGMEDWRNPWLLKDALAREDNTPEDLAAMAEFRNRVEKALSGW